MTATLLRLAILALVISFGPPVSHSRTPTAPKAFTVEGDVDGTHDPSIIKEGDTWYLFATVTGKNPRGQLPVRCSKDLHHWKKCGFVLPQIPEWIRQQSPETKDLWAPDISYFSGRYYLYYAFSIFGKNTSGIALLTNTTLNPQSPNYRWKDEGLVLRSISSDDFNAIDPNLILDDKGGAWLSFGSFWSGIKMHQIDPKTGKLDSRNTKLYSLASRGQVHERPRQPDLPPDTQAIEAPFIVRHEGYYYLFVSFDLCCRGIKSDYKTMVGRSRTVTGPYRDASGKPMLQGGGTLLLSGNQRWVGPGGESILQQKDGDMIVFHAYDARSGTPSLQISSIVWSNGWPHVVLEGDRAPRK